MTIIILDKEIPGLEGYERVEIDKKISIKRKEDVEKMQKENNRTKEFLSCLGNGKTIYECENENDLIDKSMNTICGFPFDAESYGCKTCDNLKYCKGETHGRQN